MAEGQPIRCLWVRIRDDDDAQVRTHAEVPLVGALVACRVPSFLQSPAAHVTLSSLRLPPSETCVYVLLLLALWELVTVCDL